MPGRAGGRDEEILLTKIEEEGKEAVMRRIEIGVQEQQKTMVFVTNHMKPAATTIAEIDKDRWGSEAFFKTLKQSRRSKTFVGTSENAVLIQIWTALIAMLVVKFRQLKSTFGWSLSNRVALLRRQLFLFRKSAEGDSSENGRRGLTRLSRSAWREAQRGVDRSVCPPSAKARPSSRPTGPDQRPVSCAAKRERRGDGATETGRRRRAASGTAGGFRSGGARMRGDPVPPNPAPVKGR